MKIGTNGAVPSERSPDSRPETVEQTFAGVPGDMGEVDVLIYNGLQ